ncbi:MAG TPA: hypothetical protein VE914_19525 [Candidatus Angelobacter sp.]|nr:hypothetical protein [Candidatus Angelobacter sp.]
MLISPGAAIPAASSTRSRAVIVLGVGRSGTSAITRGLGALGVELGDRLRGATRLKNPTGFYEDTDLLRINKRLKRILDVRGESVRLLEPDWWKQPTVEQLRDDAVAIIRRRFGGCPLWGYKYARTLRFMPFWTAVFDAADIDTRYLVAIRNPLSVARSRARLDPWRGTQEQSDLEWLVNVVPYFRQVRERPLVVADFDLFMADPAAQLQRIARGLDLPLSAEVQASVKAFGDEFLDPSLRHSRHGADDLDRDGRVNDLTRTAYRWLYRLATDGVDPAGAAIWLEWQEVESQVTALAPVLRHIDHVAANLRFARWNPLGPLQSIPWLWYELKRQWPAR